MSCITLRVVLFFSILTGISGRESHAARSSSDRAKNYQVTFGDSYCDFLPGHLIRMEVTFKNNTSGNLPLSQELIIVDSSGVNVWKTMVNLELAPNGVTVIPLMIPAPKQAGGYLLKPGHAADSGTGINPKIAFNVIQPKKSPRLTKILVHTPDFETGLATFLKTWSIKAPVFSWAQVLLFGRTSWTRFAAGDPVITQLVTRSLRREMSVIFLDFGPPDLQGTAQTKMKLPFGVTVNFISLKNTELSFELKSAYPELNYGFQTSLVRLWNGNDGVTVPAMDLRFEGKNLKINAYATAGKDPVRFPIVELLPQNGKGKLYLCQIITNGRLDEAVQPPRYKSEIQAYDPMAVQLLLNLISASVGDNLLK